MDMIEERKRTYEGGSEMQPSVAGAQPKRLRPGTFTLILHL